MLQQLIENFNNSTTNEDAKIFVQKGGLTSKLAQNLWLKGYRMYVDRYGMEYYFHNPEDKQIAKSHSIATLLIEISKLNF